MMKFSLNDKNLRYALRRVANALIDAQMHVRRTQEARVSAQQRYSSFCGQTRPGAPLLENHADRLSQERLENLQRVRPCCTIFDPRVLTLCLFMTTLDIAASYTSQIQTLYTTQPSAKRAFEKNEVTNSPKNLAGLRRNSSHFFVGGVTMFEVSSGPQELLDFFGGEVFQSQKVASFHGNRAGR